MSHAAVFGGGMVCMFVESFQGESKDGTNGTRDFRMASASLFIPRISTQASLYNSSLWVSVLEFSAEVQGVLLVCATCFYTVVRPYKHHFWNNADTLIPTLLEATWFELFAAAYHLPTVQTALYHASMVSVLSVKCCTHDTCALHPYWFCCEGGHHSSLKTRYRSLKRNVQNTGDTHQCEADVGKLDLILASCQTEW